MKTDADGRGNFDVRGKKLDLWSPDNPKLYKVEIESGQDKINDEIGFRDIRVEGTKIVLNGKPIFLRGVNEHAEAPYRTGRVTNDQDVDAIFGFLKDLDANFVRLCHYPQDERMMRMADRQGIMVWSEIPLWQHISFEKQSVYLKAQAMLREMVRRDRNKASVILWSVANETPDSSMRTEFLKNLVAEAHKLDSTRLVTAALLQPRNSGDTKILTDPLAQSLDVIGMNEYIGWYTYVPKQADNIKFELPQKPVIVSEFGAEAKAGNHGSKDQWWTEEQQADFYEHSFIMLSKIPQVRGFCAMDIDGLPLADSQHSRAARWLQSQGLDLRRREEEEEAFSVVQKVYREGIVGKAE